MENIRVRAIIPIEKGIVFIHRIRTIDNEVKEYYPLPGGGVEDNETVEEGLLREIKEELGLEVRINKLLYIINDDISIQYIYLCDYLSGEFGTGNGPEFNDISYSQKGKYLPEVIEFNDLDNINIVPIELKKQLLNDLKEKDLKNIEYKEINVIKTIVM